jgi:hypothetical protein
MPWLRFPLEPAEEGKEQTSWQMNNEGDEEIKEVLCRESFAGMACVFGRRQTLS